MCSNAAWNWELCLMWAGEDNHNVILYTLLFGRHTMLANSAGAWSCFSPQIQPWHLNLSVQKIFTNTYIFPKLNTDRVCFLDIYSVTPQWILKYWNPIMIKRLKCCYNTANLPKAHINCKSENFKLTMVRYLYLEKLCEKVKHLGNI